MKFDENKRVGVSQVRDLVKIIVKRQGFLVIGFPKPNLSELEMLKPGFRVRQFCQYELGDEYEAFEFGTVDDWTMQNELISLLMQPSWLPVSEDKSPGVFLRMRPTGQKS